VIVALCLLSLAVLLAIVLRGSATGSLTQAERLYLLASPLPFVLAILLPGPIALLRQGSADARALGLWLNGAGGYLSLVLVPLGVALMVRRSTRGQDRDRRLTAGLILAAIPALLIGLVGLVYHM
jgi:hypothetical protein